MSIHCIKLLPSPGGLAVGLPRQPTCIVLIIEMAHSFNNEKQSAIVSFFTTSGLAIVNSTLVSCFVWKAICEPSSGGLKLSSRTLRNKFPPCRGLSQPQMVVYMPQISTHKELIQERSLKALANRLCCDLCGVNVVATTSRELNKWESQVWWK